MSKCPRVIHVACSDRAGPNVKSDKSLYHEKSGNSERLHLWCDVHKSHTSQTHQLDLQKPVVSGVLNVALSQKPGGTTDKFRQVVKLCMRVRLRVYRGATPPGPESIQWKYREAALALFLNDVPHGTKGIKRRATLRTYLNGDWRIPRLEHFCPEDCPCQGVARDDPDMFIDSCVAALVPNSCPKLERARWNQADSAVDWCGLLSHCHQLHLVIPIWIRVIRGGRAASEADFEEQAPLPHYAHLEDDNADDLGPRGLESGSQGVGPEAAAVVDIVMHEGSEAPPLDQGQADKESRWAELSHCVETVFAGAHSFHSFARLRGITL